MKRELLLCVSISVLAFGSTASAPAIVNGYALSLVTSYEQNSDAMPSGYAMSMSATITSDTMGELWDGQITDPNLNVYDMYPTADIPDTQQLIYGDGYFYNLSELAAAHPTGNYHFEVTGGPFAGDSGDLYVPDYDFPNEIPYLTGGTWSALQGCQSGVDQYVAWDTFTHPFNSNQQTSLFVVYDYTDLGIPHYGYGDTATYTSDTISGANLRSGHYLAYNLWFNSVYHEDIAGFGGVVSDYGCINVVTGYFKVAADVGTISGQMILDYDSGLYEPIDVIITGPGGVEDTQTITLGLYGWYAFDTAVRGEKTVFFKGRHWLRKAYSVNLDYGIDHLDAHLTSGDINNDNEVSIGDYALLSSAYNTFAGDANYDDNADLNEDRAVDIGDYSILSSEYGNFGDE